MEQHQIEIVRSGSNTYHYIPLRTLLHVMYNNKDTNMYNIVIYTCIYIYINPALQPNSKRTICDWQRLGLAAWISDRVLPTKFPESINRPHIRAGVLKISQGTDNVKSGCTHRQATRKRTCANLLTIVPTVIAAQ